MRPTELYPNDDIWDLACQEAESQLYDELGRDPTDDEVTARAQILIESEPDYDAMAKDAKLDF